MDRTVVHSRLTHHVRNFFEGHRFADLTWLRGPIHNTIPGFSVIRVEPGPKTKLWVYVSRGAWGADSGLTEFMILAPSENSRHVELLAMTAYYRLEHHLGIGDTFPIGEPWVPKSRCDHFLVSRPYPFGPDLEICPLDGTHLHLQWLLPITEAEKEFAVSQGLEALETRFEQKKLQYWLPDRRSVA